MFQNEKIIETKACKHCNSIFEITDKDLEFYEKVSPSFGGKKYHIPSPTLCPNCRQQRRLSFRNERKLYKRTCDATGKPIISMFSPDKQFKVYDQKIWFSDSWDPLKYGKEFNFNKSFLEQFKELMLDVPVVSLSNAYETMENSDYNNAVGYLKNCYLLTNSDYDEDCYYGKGVNRCFKCIDNHKIYDCEMLYECVNCNKCSLSHYLFDCENCANCFYSRNLQNCKNCFGCFNLVGQEYVFFNKKLTKEEYESQVGDFLKNNTRESILNKFLDFSSKRVVKCMDLINSENSTGNYLNESSNCKECYDSENISNSRYCSDLKKGEKITDSNYDINYFGVGISNSYNSDTIGYNSDTIICCSSVWDNISKAYYSFYCFSCSNVFGCVGLRNKSYCILNKQYTKEQYEELVTKIIEHMMNTGEWGDFFPASISPFGYNETVAEEYFPLSREDVIASDSEAIQKTLDRHELPLHSSSRDDKGKTFLHGPVFNWSDYEPPFPKVDKIIPASKLPEDISDIPDDILNWAIECEVTRKPFRIIAQELEFYRKHNLPIPKRHPDQRHLDRMALRNPRKLYDRKCDKCGKDIKTTYSPVRPEIVYCEECYNKEIY